MGIYDEANIFSKYSPSAWNGYAIITANMGPEEGVSYYPVVKSWYLKSFNDRLIGRYGTAPFEHADVNMNQWYNMVFTVSNDSGKIYVNGNLVSKDKWDGVSGPSSNGYLWKIGGLYDRWFNGKIDDIAVYNKTLSAQEVNQLYNYQAAGVSQNKSYVWSNGQTTQQISVSPSVTTTYYCTVSNGYSNCTDSVTVYVSQPSSSTTEISSCSNYAWNGVEYTSSGVYTYNTTNAAGCDSIATLNLTINQLNANLFTQDTIRTCGTSYSLIAEAGFNSYLWNNGEITQSIVVGSTGLYTCTVSNGTCNKTDSVFVSIVNATILNNDTTICNGNQVTLNSFVQSTPSSNLIFSPGSNYEYSFPPVSEDWNVNIGGWVTGNAPFGNVSDGAYGAYDFNYATFWPADGADGDDLFVRRKINFTGYDLSSINYQLGVDNGYKLYVNGHLIASVNEEGYTYRWEYSGQIPAAYLNQGDNIIAVALEDHGGLTAFDMQITGNPITTTNSILWSNGESTPSITVSPNQTTTYYCTVSNGYSNCTDSVTVYVNQSSTSESNVSSCDNYIWNNINYTQSGVYTYTTINAVGCDSVATLNLTITPSTSNTTTASSCDSYTWSVNGQAYTQSGTYSLVNGCHTEVLNLTITASTSNTTTASSCDSYTWAVNGQSYTQSGTYSLVNGCHTEILNLTITPRTSNITNASSCSSYHWVANSQTYTTSGNYTFVNGCNTQYLNLTIKTNSIAASAAIASSTNITSGTSVRLSVSGGSLGTSASWKWYSASCGGTLVGTGASIFVSPTSTTTYYVRAVGTCNTTTCASVTVKVQAPCGPISVVSNVANNTICSSRSVVLSVQGTLGAGASWKWYKNGCGNGSSIGSGSTLTVSVNATTTYYVRSMGGSCGTTSCKSITITKVSTPSTPGTITGTASGVCNASGVRYSIAAVSGATSYVWTVPAGASIVTGQGTNSITVNYGLSLGVNNSCGSSSVCVKAVNTCGSSDANCLSVSNLPKFDCRNIIGPYSACINIISNYSCAVVSGATNYTWVLPTGWTIVSGQGTNLIVVKPGRFHGTIKVTPSNACGSGSSISMYVKSSRCYSPTYSKNEVEIIPESKKDVSVWPNPANSYINLNDGGLKANKIEIIDAAGRLVMITDWKTRLDLGRIRTGIYILKIHTNEGVKVKRVEVQRL
jgi:hypothetical protein